MTSEAPGVPIKACFCFSFLALMATTTITYKFELGNGKQSVENISTNKNQLILNEKNYPRLYYVQKVKAAGKSSIELEYPTN